MDPGKSNQELYMRYKQFKGLGMDLVVSPADRRLFYRDLLLLQASLICRDAIGHMVQQSFNFKELDEQPLLQAYIAYSPAETDWIEDYLKSQTKIKKCFGIITQYSLYLYTVMA